MYYRSSLRIKTKITELTMTTMKPPVQIRIIPLLEHHGLLKVLQSFFP